MKQKTNVRCSEEQQWHPLTFFVISIKRTFRVLFVVGFYLSSKFLAIGTIVYLLFQITYSLLHVMFHSSEISFHPFLFVMCMYDRTHATLYTDVTQKSITQNYEQEAQNIPTTATRCWQTNTRRKHTHVHMEITECQNALYAFLFADKLLAPTLPSQYISSLH
jgi:hypothetical protein